MSLTAEQFLALDPLLGTLRLPYCPHEPTVKQEFFLLRRELEVFFGGAAGPGKSWGLLMGGLQYVDREGYHALLLRPSLTEFEQPGGLMEVSHDWLSGTQAYWNGTHRRWTFPSKATLRFGYLATASDLDHYKGPSYSYCGFDELTSFPERLYRGMFRILRQSEALASTGIPLRMRGASNPGGIGHHWVKAKFIEEETRDEKSVYIPAKMSDNPFLDVPNYLLSLAHMLPHDRERLINGDWDVAEEGSKFHRASFLPITRDEMARPVKQVRYWDLAGTAPTLGNPDPDFTVGLAYEVDAEGFFTITDIRRERIEDHEVEKLVRSMARSDGSAVEIYIEQDPGQAGKAQLSNYKRKILQGFACRAGLTRINGQNAAKEVRARPVAAAVGNLLVRILDECANSREFLDEVTMFPNAAHDDCVDALSGAHNAITGRMGRGAMKTHVATGRLPVAGGDRPLPPGYRTDNGGRQPPRLPPRRVY